MTHYQTLQINENASREVIEAAWKALMLQHHPDKGGNAKTASKINLAHDVLCDPQKRAAYDLQLKSMMGPKAVKTKPRPQAAYPSAYPQVFPEIDMDRMIRETLQAGASAAADVIVNQLIEKNPAFKSILENVMKKARKTG